MKHSALSEKKKLLQEKLDSNLKDLQEAETLASLQSDSANGKKGTKLQMFFYLEIINDRFMPN